MPTTSLLFGSLFFSAVGLAAFVYGRKSALWKPVVIGMLLMAFPYLISNSWLFFATGAALCVSLYIFRD
jgi:hypothetical protein